jgi:hypothetical protein
VPPHALPRARTHARPGVDDARDELRVVRGREPALERDHAEREELAGVVLERGERLVRRGGDRRLDVLPYERVHVLAGVGAVSARRGPRACGRRTWARGARRH